VLTIPDGGLPLHHNGQRNIINIAMDYPGTIALYDDHQGPHLPGISSFMTIHEAMNLGYRFLLDLEVIPINGRFAFSMKPHQYIERHEKEQPARVSSAHLRQLMYACERLGFIGIIGEVEVV